MHESKMAVSMRVLLPLGLLPLLMTAEAAVPAEQRPVEDSPLWNAAWITDTQTPQSPWIAALMARVAANRPQMVLHTGDTRFEWANRCAWRDVMWLMRIGTRPIEFHLAPGNHDLQNGVLHRHLRRAASQGVYRLDTGMQTEGQGFYHGRMTEDASGPLWPVWNPEVRNHPAWQPSANKQPQRHTHPEPPYRYVFRRGGIRFIVCDCYYTDQQRDWVRRLITQPDQSSISILLQHKHEVDDLAKYFEGLQGRHNVKLVLSGDHHNYGMEQRHGVTFITAAGMAHGQKGDCDAMTLWVFKDRVQLDRYLLPKGQTMDPIQGPETIWTCRGRFSAYQPVAPQAASIEGRSIGSTRVTRTAVEDSVSGRFDHTVGPNLLFNGNFDNFIWYDRYRGWSPSGWYQWFTRGGHAPEHAVGRRLPHSGKEYVRVHMWAHAWRGGILQNVSGVHPCHVYRLTAYGFFQPEGAPEPKARIGIDPCGTLAEQFSVDVTRYPPPPYDEGVGNDPKRSESRGPDVNETTIWSDYGSHYRWGKFQVTAEARSDTITAILYCFPKQRPEERPIYEMNWDTVSLREVPWPARRIVDNQVVLTADERLDKVRLTLQPELNTAQLTWRSKLPVGATQVLYRFLDAKAVAQRPDVPESAEVKEPVGLRAGDFPFESPVHYERSVVNQCVEIGIRPIPKDAVELHAVALSRVLLDGKCTTLCSSPVTIALPQKQSKTNGEH